MKILEQKVRKKKTEIRRNKLRTGDKRETGRQNI